MSDRFCVFQPTHLRWLKVIGRLNPSFGDRFSRALVLLFLSGCLVLSQSCAQEPINRPEMAAANQTSVIEAALETSTQELGSPVFIRIVKTRDGTRKDGYLELFLQNTDGTFEAYKSWPICTYSGDLGPKLKEGDRQSPEGFYFVNSGRMNPNSSYHLSFNLGFPNAFDRVHGRTGSYLMVHGNCVSIGCYAMTDPVIEEIYTIMGAAFRSGQSIIRVHSFPFPMTDALIEKHSDNPNIEFWKNLKQGWDWFETRKRPPNVTVANKTYVFSAAD